MEPRHQDLVADELLDEPDLDGDDELGPDEDDTGYDKELEAEDEF